MSKLLHNTVRAVKAACTRKTTASTHKHSHPYNERTGSNPPLPSNRQLQKELTHLEHMMNGWERVIRLIAFPFIALSAWLTTKGLFDAKIEAHAANTEGMITAAMTAIVAAIMIGGANILLFGLATHAGKKQRWQVIALTAAILPFVGAISTYNAILATSAERSVILALRDRAVAWETYSEAAMQDAMKAGSAEKAMAAHQTAICTLAERENSHGSLTGGGPGEGAVYAAYDGACKTIGSIINTLNQTVTITHKRQNEVNIILSAMEAIPRKVSITVFERQEQFKDQDRRLRKIVTDSASERVADSLSTQLSILENSVATIGVKKGEFGHRQTQAIAKLEVSLANVSGIVRELVNAADESTVKPPEAMLNVDQAMARYWKHNISTIAISIASDTFSLWLICFLFVARSTMQHRRQELEAGLQAQSRNIDESVQEILS